MARFGPAAAPALALVAAFGAPNPAFAEVCDKGLDLPAGVQTIAILVVPLLVLLAISAFAGWRAWFWLVPGALSGVIVWVSYLDLTETYQPLVHMREQAIREGCAWEPTTVIAVFLTAAIGFLWLFVWQRRAERG